MDFVEALNILQQYIPHWLEGLDNNGFYINIGVTEPLLLREPQIIQLALALTSR